MLLQPLAGTSILLLAASAAADYWRPTAGTPWQIVLSKNLKSPYPKGIKAIDGDLYSNPASTWAAIKASGIKTICYFSAGSYEDWRPDASQFNKKTDLGDPLDGWEGEWWLNTKSANVRRIMKQRLDLAAKKGCNAVDPDNVDAYDNDGGGLGLTQKDAVDYVTFLAAEAHKRNMSVGLKNAGAIVKRVLSVVDFQVNEQCQQYDECDQFQPFIKAGKPVFAIEYTKTEKTIPSAKTIKSICSSPDSKRFSTVIKHLSLNEWVVACNSSSTKATDAANVTTQQESSGSRPGWNRASGWLSGYIIVWFTML